MVFARIDPNWLLVIVGTATAAVVAWQSWETRKAAQAGRRSADVALIQTELQIASIKQWIEVSISKVTDKGQVQDRSGGLQPSRYLEIIVEATNRTPYPLTFRKVKVCLHWVDREPAPETIYTLEQDTVLVPGDYYSSRIGFVILPTLTDRLLWLYESDLLMFSIAGVIVFRPVIGPEEQQEFSLIGRPAANGGEAVPNDVVIFPEETLG